MRCVLNCFSDELMTGRSAESSAGVPRRGSALAQPADTGGGLQAPQKKRPTAIARVPVRRKRCGNRRPGGRDTGLTVTFARLVVHSTVHLRQSTQQSVSAFARVTGVTDKHHAMCRVPWGYEEVCLQHTAIWC